jgi:RNA polymerase-binding transcription factor DksA
MTQQFIKEMEEKLVAERTRIHSELDNIAAQNPKNKQDHITTFQNFGEKEDENAAEVEEYSANLTLERTLEATLRDLDSAIERIKKGTYGICKYCNKEIDEKRLRARPESSSCINCKKSFTQEF